MSKSIDFLNNITLNINKSEFSAEAKTAGWDIATENLCKALAKVLDTAKRINDYERQDSNCSTYDGLYGADEICDNLPKATRNIYRDSYNRGHTSVLFTNSCGFYNTAYQIATQMWGLSTTELPKTTFRTSGYDFTTGMTYGSKSVGLDYYDEMTEGLAGFGIELGDYWTISRFISGLSYGEEITIDDETSYYNGKTLKNDYSSNDFLYYPHKLFGAICNIRGHLKILKVIMDNTPTTGGRGGRTFPASYSLRDCLYSFPQFQPHDIVRIRQALTEVRAGYTANGYDPYNPGTATNSITSGRIRNRIKKALANRNIIFASAEIPDKTRDIAAWQATAPIIDDPLIIAAAGFAAVEQADSHASTDGSWWASLVPAVHICRKYLSRSRMIAYDYKETTNPNAFEAAGGKVAYLKSNRFVYLNMPFSQSRNDWKVQTHDYDEYWTGQEYPYLASISKTLLCNIAKTMLGVNPGETLSDVLDTDCPNCGREQWCFLPTLTMFGVANRSSARQWTNTQLGMDLANYIDTDGETWGMGFAADGNEINGEGVSMEEPDACSDLIENAWELGSRRYQFRVNPNSEDAATERTELYIPTQTPAVYKADSRDATVPNRVACFYLPKADGTATTNQLGQSSPFNYHPFTVAFALIPFHTTQTDNTYKGYANGAFLTYKTPTLDDLKY